MDLHNVHGSGSTEESHIWKEKVLGRTKEGWCRKEIEHSVYGREAGRILVDGEGDVGNVSESRWWDVWMWFDIKCMIPLLAVGCFDGYSARVGSCIDAYECLD